MTQSGPLKLGVLISGTGRSLQNLIQRIATAELNAQIKVVLSSKASAGGLEIAAAARIPTHTMPRSAFATAAAHRDAIFDIFRHANVDLVVMAGYVQHLLIPDDFQWRVINIHPSLIPNFCGKGFYGLRVHSAVLAAGAPATGCTVHFVDDQYDHGPVILQRRVEVSPEDTAELLAERVFSEECEALPEAIRLIAAGRVGCENGEVLIR